MESFSKRDKKRTNQKNDIQKSENVKKIKDGAEGGTRTPTPAIGIRSLVLRVYQFHHSCTGGKTQIKRNNRLLPKLPAVVFSWSFFLLFSRFLFFDRSFFLLVFLLNSFRFLFFYGLCRSCRSFFSLLFYSDNRLVTA